MAFCIVDGDALKQGDLKQGPKIEFIISTPCFEIWFLLHYKFTAKEFNNCAGLITHELKKYIPDYQKSQNYQKKKNFYEMLKKNLNKAIENAKKLDEENKKSGKLKGTSTEVYKILEKIL
ncbi:MAG: RloB domain-containing protein [Candidatus Aminicenantes bacterium]|nr:RloB domain-containing protein [Candidatus Aminicenantes bacterium]